MKNPFELTQLGREISKEYLENGKELNTTLEKVANTHGLTREEIKRVAEQANVETYLGLVDRVQDRYVEFELADATNVITKVASRDEPIAEPTLEEMFADLPGVEFSFSMYKNVPRGTEVITKVASASNQITNDIYKVQDLLKFAENTLGVMFVKTAELNDDIHDEVKQYLLSGTSFADVAEIVKFASANIAETYLPELRDDMLKILPNIDFEKKASENVMPNVTSELFKSLNGLEHNLLELTKQAAYVLQLQDEVNTFIKENTEMPQIKLAGVTSEIVKAIQHHPIASGSTVAAVAAYKIGKNVQENRDLKTFSKISPEETQRIMYNKSLVR